MDDAFQVVSVDEGDDSVTLKLSGRMIGPVAEALRDEESPADAYRARYALGCQLLTARRIMNGHEVNEFSRKQMGAVTVVPIKPVKKSSKKKPSKKKTEDCTAE